MSEKRKRGRPRKYRDTREQEVWAPDMSTTRPVKLAGPGRKKTRDSISPQAVSLITRAALDRHGLHHVLIPATMTQTAACVVLLQHGLAIADVARTLSCSERQVRNGAANWRKRQKMSYDEWQAIIQQNAEARSGVRAGRFDPGEVPVRPRPAPPKRPEATEEELAEIMQFVTDVGHAAARIELELQLGRPVTWEEIEALPDARVAALLTAGDIRKADDRTRWR